MTIDDLFHGMMRTTAQAASEVVANVFNVTPGPFRPVALAALRISVDVSVATMDEDAQAAYAAALECLTCTAVKKPKGDASHESKTK